MRHQRVISGIYTQGDAVNGNIYGTRQARSRKHKPAPVTVMRPVEVKVWGVDTTTLRPVKVIKSPHAKRLDKQDRMWYACLSK